MSTEKLSENLSVVSHVSVGTNQFDLAVGFYDAVLKTIGCKQIVSYSGAVGYGKVFPEFWVQKPIDGKPATIGNGNHIGFTANSKEAVNDFYNMLVKCGGDGDGEPGPRAEYGEAYYGCFGRDLDGNKIEATFWQE